MRFSPELLRLLPAVVLLGAIGVSGALIVRDHEDPQASTAFAMFGSIDIAATRHVLVEVPDRPGLELTPPDNMKETVRRLRESPSPSRADALAAELATLTWQVTGDEATPGGSERFAEVRVRVVGLVAEGRTISRRELVSATAGRGR